MTKAKNFYSLILLLYLFSFTACTTSYKGPKPDYSLKGEQAHAEIKKFRFDEGLFSNGTEVVTMGPDNKHYDLNSVRSIIQSVSPKADKKIILAKRWERLGHLLLATALGIFIAEVAGPSDDAFKNDVKGIYYGLLGGSLISSFVTIGYMQSAVKSYNRDLESKFSSERGTVGFNFSFQY